MSIDVFVFGTLKEGFPNFGTNKGARVPGDFVTVQRYPLCLVGERHSPWLINTPGEGKHVIGQVFRVAPRLLAEIDALERVGEADGYERIQIQVRRLGGEQAAELSVHAYLKDARHLKEAPIMAGPLSEYKPEHAALYRKRAL